MGVILHAHPVRGESHNEHNANREVATPLWALACLSEMSKDQDWIRTEANFGGVRTGSDYNFFQNWRIRTGSD